MADSRFRIIDRFFSAFDSILSDTEGDIDALGKSVALPLFSPADVTELCLLATDQFRSQPMVLRIDYEVVIVGDIHGSFHDLVRILWKHGLHASYLFLGDYVDRGPFSLECIVLLFTLFCQYPNQISLLRGNHELRKIAEAYGFRQELSGEYPETVFDAFCTTFSWMPLAAVVQDRYFCVHGGIGPTIRSVASVEAIERPILTDAGEDVKALLWADPSGAVSRFGDSVRIDTTVYGRDAVQQFLQTTKLQGIIRAHEMVDGFKTEKTMPVVTVFSASNYSTGSHNGSGVLVIPLGGRPEPYVYDPIERMRREEAMFFMAGRGVRPITPPASIGSLHSVTLPAVPSGGAERMGAGMRYSFIGQVKLGRIAPTRPQSIVRRRSETRFTLPSMATFAIDDPIPERKAMDD
jgi:protein phosphatase